MNVFSPFWSLVVEQMDTARRLFAHQHPGRSFLMKRFNRPNRLRTSSGSRDQFSTEND